MTKKTIYTLRTIALVVAVILISQNIPFLPWWSFVIPVILLGIFISFLEWKIASFAVGFLSGFLVWLGCNNYFDSIYNGILLHKLAPLLFMNKVTLLLASGLIGGLLTGLALYTGKTVLKHTSPPVPSL
jgi:hypothetical protein